MAGWANRCAVGEPSSSCLRVRDVGGKSCILRALWYTYFVHYTTAHEAIRQAAQNSDALLRADYLDVPAPAMSRMERAGVLHRVVPGIYIGSRHERHPLIEPAGWTLRYPQMVACLLTAAVYFDLTAAFARGTWLYVPKGSSVPRSRFSSLHVVQTAPRFIEPDQDEANGIGTMELHRVKLRITSPDRTVLDLWRYPRRIPAEFALEALRRRVRAEAFHLPTFARLGRHLGVWRRLEPVVQGVML